MKKRNDHFVRITAAAAGALLVLTACGGPALPAQGEEGSVQAIEVHTTSAGQGTIDRQTEFVGRVESAESIKVYATSQAKVLETYVTPGQHVEKGQLLFELDTETLETMAETARLQYEAAVSGSNTTIIQTKSAWDSAGDMYTTLKDNRDAIEDARDAAKAGMDKAQKALEDAKALKNDPNLPEDQKPTDEDIAALEKAAAAAAEGYNQAQNAYIQNYDKLDEQVSSARKNLVNARDTYKNTKGDEDEGITGTVQSQIDLAKISYDNAMKALNEAKVYAPVSGIVSAKNVAVSDMVSPGAPAYVIDQEGAAPMVSFNLSEDGANALSVGSPVTVVYNGQEFSAQITELANTANPQTGLYAAKAQTDEPLGTSRSGGVVKVKASTAKAEDAMLLSLDLLEYDGNQPFVYVYRDGKAVRTDVTTGISSAEEIVILSGLTKEDQIITTWHPDLKDGAAVTMAQ
ncbi:MAG: efflux RND transporter periplasmic adaptor subunit [Angelakisella sp.]|jgi:RND family efflux transporter MFP subunit|nr:efflux RND transporter periplasmic adaptor subunit [Angelakisella sp.]